MSKKVKFNTRSSTMILNCNELPEDENVETSIHKAFQPWLDELDKDGLKYQDLEYLIEELPDDDVPNILSITAVVMVPIQE